jgi:molecular chaperone GrpE
MDREKTKEQVVGTKAAESAEEVRDTAEATSGIETPDETLEAELDAAKSQAEEYLDQLQRTVAQFSNYRKRIEREQAQFRQLANATLITRLLPVVDDFERAFETMPPNLSGVTWIEGLALIYRKLQHVLEQQQVEAIETEGEVFDPLLHQAVTYETAEGFEEGQIIAEVQKGYKLGERVLRPSMVRVAR